jgi:uncharacterized membrane protein
LIGDRFTWTAIGCSPILPVVGTGPTVRRLQGLEKELFCVPPDPHSDDRQTGLAESGSGFMLNEPPDKPSLWLRLRNYFFTGVIVSAPIAITIFLVWQFVTFLDSRVSSLIPSTYNPETYLPFGLPGIGLIFMLAFLTLIGFMTASFAGRTLVRTGERLLSRMPIVRSVYGTLKQIFETVLNQSSKSFREVVLIEYPRRGIGAIGFVTGPTQGEVQDRTEEDLVNVFLPTTPNPTSGFLLFVPRKDLIHLNMTVEEGIKMVISGGIVAPPAIPEEEPAPRPRAAAMRLQPEPEDQAVRVSPSTPRA